MDWSTLAHALSAVALLQAANYVPTLASVLSASVGTIYPEAHALSVILGLPTVLFALAGHNAKYASLIPTSVLTILHVSAMLDSSK